MVYLVGFVGIPALGDELETFANKSRLAVLQPCCMEFPGSVGKACKSEEISCNTSGQKSERTVFGFERYLPDQAGHTQSER